MKKKTVIPSGKRKALQVTDWFNYLVQDVKTSFIVTIVILICSGTKVFCADISSTYHSAYTNIGLAQTGYATHSYQNSKSTSSFNVSLEDSKFIKYNEALFDEDTIYTSSTLGVNDSVVTTSKYLFINGSLNVGTHNSQGGAASYLVSGSTTGFRTSGVTNYSTFASTSVDGRNGNTQSAIVVLEYLIDGGRQRQTVFWFESGSGHNISPTVPSEGGKGKRVGTLPAGEYQFTVYARCGNRVGWPEPYPMSAFAEYSLYVTDLLPEGPPEVLTGPATKNRLENATLNGTIRPNGNAVTAQFYWSSDENTIFTNRVNVVLNDPLAIQNVSVDIGFPIGFRSGPAQIRYMLVVESAGNSYYGQIKEFSLPKIDPPDFLKDSNGKYSFLRKKTAPGLRYQLQRSKDLRQETWTDLGSPVIGDGSTITTPVTVGLPQEFFRYKIEDPIAGD